MGDYDFGILKNDGRTIDEKIKKLEKIWESPQNILCRRGENIEESKQLFANFIEPIEKIHDELIEDMGPRADYLKDMDRFLLECATACEQLSQDVDDIETLFSEYGYQKPEIANHNHSQVNNDEIVDPNANNSILSPEQMEHLSINSPISDEMDSNFSPIPSSVSNNTEDIKPKYIATPVIKSVASVMQAELLKNHNIGTPMNGYPFFSFILRLRSWKFRIVNITSLLCYELKENLHGTFIMGEQTNLCHGKDVFERMNFLYQASRMISKIDTDAASCYANMMINCAKKAVLRIEPEIKRSICKGCKCPLIPGETARVRLVSKPVKAIKYSCLKCKITKRIPTKKGYKLWSDDPQAVVRLYDYKQKEMVKKSDNNTVKKGKTLKNETKIDDNEKK